MNNYNTIKRLSIKENIQKYSGRYNIIATKRVFYFKQETRSKFSAFVISEETVAIRMSPTAVRACTHNAGK